MSTRARVPFKVRGRLAYDYDDNVSLETLRKRVGDVVTLN